jgi:hypothetical protein
MPRANGGGKSRGVSDFIDGKINPRHGEAAAHFRLDFHRVLFPISPPIQVIIVAQLHQMPLSISTFSGVPQPSPMPIPPQWSRLGARDATAPSRCAGDAPSCHQHALAEPGGLAGWPGLDSAIHGRVPGLGDARGSENPVASGQIKSISHSV